MSYGCQSMTAPVRRMLVKHPKDAFGNAAQLAAQWRDLNYAACPDYDRAVKEYDYLISLLFRTVRQIEYLPTRADTGLDSIYVHDPVIVTSRGAILCNMGKEQRRNEPDAAGNYLEQAGVPVWGRITGEGTAEGGDIVWIDERTLAVGQGYRTNAEGIRQLRELTRDVVDELVTVPLVHWTGPGDVLHLMSILSPIDHDLALVYSRLLPVPLRQWLLDRGIRLVEVPDEEYDSMGCNVLAVAPRKCIMIAGNPRTRQRLEEAGAEVRVFAGDEICRKGAGGPTCLTRPIWRE